MRDSRASVRIARNLGVLTLVGMQTLALGKAQAGEDIPLQYGWKLACAIENTDVNRSDRCRSQEKIALAYLGKNDAESAHSCGAEIANWEKGWVLAKVADWYATHNDSAKAEAMMPELQVSGLASTGWERDRINMAITRVQALLGHESVVAGSCSNMFDRAELTGDAAASLALVLSRTGRVDEANAVLGKAKNTKNPDVAASCSQGYLDLVADGHLDPKTASATLTNAWNTTQIVKPYRRWELQMTVMESMATNGMATQAREHLEEVASNIVTAVRLPPEVRASLLTQGAILWKRFGEAQRATNLLQAAEQTVDTKLEDIFRPYAFAKMAEGYAALGDGVQARAYYGHALDLAVKLVNPRPRAIAGVDVCVSLSGAGVMDPEIQKKLDSLLGTFTTQEK